MAGSYERAIIWAVVVVLIVFFAYFFAKPIADGLDNFGKGLGLFGYLFVFSSLLAVAVIIARKLR